MLFLKHAHTWEGISSVCKTSYIEKYGLGERLFDNSVIFVFSFEFVKSSGCNIVPVQVPRGQEKNARVMKQISGQGPLYIRAMETLNFEKVILILKNFSLG